MDASWACSAAYVYVLHLPPALRAWEYLRRNPRYVHDWMQYRRSASQRVAARWGLESLVDPRLDAREVSPVWVIDESAPVTLVRDEMGHARTDVDGIGRFSLWRLVGRKSLVGDERGFRLVAHSSAKGVQVRLGGRLGEGDRFAYQIPSAADERAAWAALTGFRALMPVLGGSSEPSPERPGRADLFHVRALQVLDGLAAGATHRETAIGLFGRGPVVRAWESDGALRAQVRYLIRRARALKEGEYRLLVGVGQLDPPSERDVY